MHGLKNVTPQTVAYACVHVGFLLSFMSLPLPYHAQARVALASQSNWDNVDNHGFNNEALYNLIVNLLDDPEDLWVEETLAWWDKLSVITFIF